MRTIPEELQLIYNGNGTFVSPIYTFYLTGNINVYTPIQGKNRDITLIILSIKEKCRL